MTVKIAMSKALRMIRKYTPTALTYTGAAGIGATAWLAFDAGATYASRGDEPLTRKDVAKILVKPVCVAAGSTALILTGHHIQNSRLKRLGNAYNKLAMDYRALEAATIGAFGMEGRKRVLEEQVKQLEVAHRPELKENEYEFYDSVTGQTFVSTLSDVYEHQSDIAEILSGKFYLSLPSYCDIFGLPHRYRNCNGQWVENLNDLGWDGSEMYDYKECGILQFYNQKMTEPDGYIWYHMGVDIPPTVDGILNGEEPASLHCCYDEYGLARTTTPWMNG